MICPQCNKQNTKVIDKRNNIAGSSIRRRRECLYCNFRFTTYERIENTNFVVRKKSGKVEDFDRNKLKASLIKGLNKRHITENDLDDFVDRIEVALRSKKKVEIGSEEIGAEILDLLKKVDPIAYILYATVYLDFKNLEQITAEIVKIKE